LDIAVSDKEYSITVETSGANEKDVKVEIVDDTMPIRGNKKQENEEKKKDYCWVERSSGSFQRVLSLPKDTDQVMQKQRLKTGC
jgi:HSP20 family protein